MSANERRDLALAELVPGLYALVLRVGESISEGYILRCNMSLVEATLLMREILAPGNGRAWLATLLPHPWRVVELDSRQLHGQFNAVLPEREGGWPQ